MVAKGQAQRQFRFVIRSAVKTGGAAPDQKLRAAAAVPGRRQVQPTVLEPAIQPNPVLNGGKKVGARAGDEIAQIHDKTDEMRAQRFVVLIQRHAPVLLKQGARLVESPFANLLGQAPSAERIVILIILTGHLPGARHFRLEPTAPVVAQPARRLACGQLLRRRHGQQNHPIRQVKSLDHRQHIGIFLLQADQKGGARHQIIPHGRNSETRRAVAQVTADQALHHPGMEQKDALRGPEHPPPKGSRRQSGRHVVH